MVNKENSDKYQEEENDEEENYEDFCFENTSGREFPSVRYFLGKYRKHFMGFAFPSSTCHPIKSF